MARADATADEATKQSAVYGKLQKGAASLRTRTIRRPRLTYVVGSLDRILRREMTNTLAPLGLTLAQFTALSVLEWRGEASNAQLAERSFITPQAANEVISVMVSRNWITRGRDPDHGRIIVLSLTDEGRELLYQCMEAANTVEERMMAGLDPDIGTRMYADLERIIRNLRGCSDGP
ncbi:MarR family transcriptional regulator [Burkholderia cenocepacia]|uniref:MarR family winged helix-turn-helix transcriptional regulator n=1 Tax=Burkholderia cenocepacia TaxID=95486 RepID=UPI0023BA3C36|nr:MarR family transcriptional regulator [Burkholderia cenocepacia]MDF0500590.1 MarR family transcriptional regulator [Burkholderia cenocepacia]